MNFLYPEKIINDLNLFKNRDYKLIFTNGCFDILHSGHIRTLKFAKQFGDKLIVAINSDESIIKLKGEHRPIVPLVHRLNVVSALEMVDFVTYFDNLTPESLISAIKPDILIKGEDYKNKIIAGSEFCNDVILSPFYNDVSTSLIIEKYIEKIKK